MRSLKLSFLPLALFLWVSNVFAYATVTIQNNTGKSVIEAGDMVQVLIQHSLDEQFSEISFGTATQAIYTGGWNAEPFITKMNSSDGQKYDVLIEFTVPHDFSSYDSSFLFSARLLKNGGPYTQAGHQRIIVRGIPKAVAPVDAAGVNGAVTVNWVPVYAASQYHFELVRFINSIGQKDHSVSAAEIMLDTLTETNGLTFFPSKTGKYSWVVRAKADDVWGTWGAASTFNVLSTGSLGAANRRTGIRLYPLPANDVINIECSVGYVKQVDVYDLAGKHLTTEGNVAAPLGSFDVRHLSAGLYHVKLILNNGEATIPFIKQ
jgi:hypothetical protein